MIRKHFPILTTSIFSIASGISIVENDIGIFFETEWPPPLFISHCSSICRSTNNQVTQQPSRSSGGRSSRLFGILISRRALCGFESRPRRNVSLGHGCCDCP
ncbi:unnamed protein product [Acanthoscelides obtectus]|uniref:Uncharacterized protein n=1 Tax=Acanthoscelides obtectus TaxID=200917 RepID=A0A9P0MJH7_ACAOB|nr:unnamed protein product [Acanthoscelides obtectus]CAK1641259.1 hypothetical protein AOBTE_LOCUS12280 [Acanthoscelides obtectus]